ncbi:hypothetical protein C8Q75DRAFT_77173 [Abortiporus biennis]|nr:hypothetical protein C8Q75DRAFT_77173 [Abortiporus biennis]
MIRNLKAAIRLAHSIRVFVGVKLYPSRGPRSEFYGVITPSILFLTAISWVLTGLHEI